MRAKKPKIKEEDLVKRYQDLLEIGRLVSWCMNRDHVIRTCLDHINQRLGKRGRYLLMEGDELKLHCWVGRYECPIEQVPVHKESIVWRIVEEGESLNLTDAKEIEGYRHTLAEEVKIKAIIPLRSNRVLTSGVVTCFWGERYFLVPFKSTSKMLYFM